MDVAVHFQITDLEIRYRLLRKQAVVHTAPCKPVALPNPYRLQYLFLLMRAGWLKRTHLPCFTHFICEVLIRGHQQPRQGVPDENGTHWARSLVMLAWSGGSKAHCPPGVYHTFLPNQTHALG